ncbi:MAG: hypothetical protein U5K74_05375 [Gemmatimonadaceae bacterium]|nr:hypothetical protein [Gemmatimonadaceae bacterium]
MAQSRHADGLSRFRFTETQDRSVNDGSALTATGDDDVELVLRLLHHHVRWANVGASTAERFRRGETTNPRAGLLLEHGTPHLRVERRGETSVPRRTHVALPQRRAVWLEHGVVELQERVSKSERGALEPHGVIVPDHEPRVNEATNDGVEVGGGPCELSRDARKRHGTVRNHVEDAVVQRLVSGGQRRILGEQRGRLMMQGRGW